MKILRDGRMKAFEGKREVEDEEDEG